MLHKPYELLYTVFSFLAVPASQLTPLLASKQIGNKVWILSVIETAFSVGALAVSLLLAYKDPPIPHLKLLGLSSVIFGATILLLLPVHRIVMFAVFMLIMGMGSPLYYTPMMTHIQENTQENYRGRTLCYVDLFSSLVAPSACWYLAP